jgi:hypothetical protein
MPLFVATVDSVRERILVELVRHFDTQLKTSDGYPFAWEKVIREPLMESNRRKNYELAIIDRGELKEINMGCQHATLELDFEWSSLLGRDDDPSVRANEIILALERRLNENVYVFAGGDSTGQQLALRAWTIGNEYNADNETDRRIEGVMFIRVLYKHGVADPRQQIQ